MSPGNMFWNNDKIDATMSTVIPDINPGIVHALIVSPTDILKNLLIAQNPESFGSDRPIPPAHIAIAHKIGETPDVTIVVTRIDDVAVVAIAVSNNATTAFNLNFKIVTNKTTTDSKNTTIN